LKNLLNLLFFATNFIKNNKKIKKNAIFHLKNQPQKNYDFLEPQFQV